MTRTGVERYPFPKNLQTAQGRPLADSPNRREWPHFAMLDLERWILMFYLDRRQSFACSATHVGFLTLHMSSLAPSMYIYYRVVDHRSVALTLRTASMPWRHMSFCGAWLVPQR